MTHIEQAIKEAVEKGGYWSIHRTRIHDFNFRRIGRLSPAFGLGDHVLLDPSFWQALGRARGWEELVSKYGTRKDDYIALYRRPGTGRNSWEKQVVGSEDSNSEWRYHWHRFIDHLAEGKDAESFFAALLPEGSG